MNNKKAIEILRSIRVYDIYPKSASEETKQALDLAIRALEERPQGEWLFKYDEGWFCSNCNMQSPLHNCFNFCPNCGAEMRGKE